MKRLAFIFVVACVFSACGSREEHAAAWVERLDGLNKPEFEETLALARQELPQKEYDLVRRGLIELDPIYFALLPDEEQSEEDFAVWAIRKTGADLMGYIPIPKRTEEMFMAAVEVSPRGLSCGGPEEAVTDRVLKHLAAQHPLEGLRRIPEHRRTPEICRIAVKKDPKAGFWVPEGVLSREELRDLGYVDPCYRPDPTP